MINLSAAHLVPRPFHQYSYCTTVYCNNDNNVNGETSGANQMESRSDIISFAETTTAAVLLLLAGILEYPIFYKRNVKLIFGLLQGRYLNSWLVSFITSC